MMQEAVAFWEDYLKPLPDGRLVAPLGWSPEHGPIEDGVSYDQEIIWDLFNNTVEAADVLGDVAVPQPHRGAARPPRHAGIGSWGQLLEWMEEKKDKVLDTPGDTHRHVSHLFGLFRDADFADQTPALAAAARKSLEARGDAGTGWSMAWKTAYWARLLDGDHAYKMLRGQLAKPGARARSRPARARRATTPAALTRICSMRTRRFRSMAISAPRRRSAKCCCNRRPGNPPAAGAAFRLGQRFRQRPAARGGYEVDLAGPTAS
jgi:alpha-L-fucosidase 2